MNRKEKNIFMAIILLCFLTMTIGYAIYSERINISGVSSITSEFNVRFSDIKSVSTGGAYDITPASYTDTTAKFSTGFISPGDKMTYEITVTNAGNINAVLQLITVTDSENPVINYSYEGVIEGNVLEAGDSLVITLDVEFDPTVTDQPESLTSSLEFKLDYIQTELDSSNNIVLTTTPEECFTFNSATQTITDYDETCGTQVIIPETIGGVEVKTIGSFAMSHGYIEYLDIPDTVTTIESYAFASNSISTLYMSQNIETIGDAAFNFNSISNAINLPNSLKKIGNDAFSWNSIPSISIPSSVVDLGDSAFTNNKTNGSNDQFIYARNSDGSIDYTTLNSYAGESDVVVVPDGITTLGYASLSNCDITSVTLPNGLVEISDLALSHNNFEYVDIPDTVTNIRGFGFAQSGLKRVDLSNNLIIIDDSAFTMNSISSISLPNTLTTIGASAFASNLISSIEIPVSVTTLGEGAFTDNRTTGTDDQFIYARNNDGSIDYTILNSYAGKSDVITIPSTVTVLGAYAISNSELTSITLPDNLTTINSHALSFNNFTSVTIPSNVTTIYDFGLAGNYNLTNIVNKPGIAFDWGSILDGFGGESFVSGTYGSVTITTE